MAVWLFRRAADIFFGWNNGANLPLCAGVALFAQAAALGDEEAQWLLEVLASRPSSSSSSSSSTTTTSSSVLLGLDTSRAELRACFEAKGDHQLGLFVAGALALDDAPDRAVELLRRR